MSDLSDNRSEPQRNTPLPRNLIRLALLAGSLSVVALFGMRVLQVNLPANSTVRTFVDYYWQSISVISGSVIGITFGVLAALRGNDSRDLDRPDLANHIKDNHD